MIPLVALSLAAYPVAALAHVSGMPVNLDPWLLAPLLLGIALYALGLRRLWQRGIGHGVKPAQAAAFFAGWIVMLASLVWPLDALAERSLAAHMSQHVLLMAVAPPLLLLGVPGATWLAAITADRARAIMRPLRSPYAAAVWGALTAPVPAMLLQSAVMWSWHLPAAMDAALRSTPLHILMHSTFLVAGLLFWTGLLRSLREPLSGAGNGLVALVATMMQMGLLGALMTFARDARYTYYIDRVPGPGMTALEDQQLAGLIMWVPAAVPYLAGGILLAAAWLARAERHQRHMREDGS